METSNDSSAFVNIGFLLSSYPEYYSYTQVFSEHHILNTVNIRHLPLWYDSWDGKRASCHHVTILNMDLIVLSLRDSIGYKYRRSSPWDDPTFAKHQPSPDQSRETVRRPQNVDFVRSSNNKPHVDNISDW